VTIRAASLALILSAALLLTSCIGTREPDIIVGFSHTPEEPHVGQLVAFDASRSHHMDGTIVAWHWEFPGGETASGLTATYRFEQPGDHAVRLTVVDAAGAEASTNHTITVEEAPAGDRLEAQFSASRRTGEAPLHVEFDASASTGNIERYTWDFGDGETGSGVTTSHEYTSPNTYTVGLTVEDSAGRTTTAYIAIQVREADADPPEGPEDPEASFTASPERGEAPLTVSFDASASTGEIEEYSWDFGDGSTGDGVQPSNVYHHADEYTVELTVIDSDGRQDSMQRTIRVLEEEDDDSGDPGKLQAKFTATPEEGQAPLEVTFDASASTGDIEEYLWDFGDGNRGEGEVTTHTYEEPGTYTVQLTVRDSDHEEHKRAQIEVQDVPEPPPPPPSP